MPSRADTLYVFAVCALPIFAWAIFSYLYALPGFVLRLTIWDLIATASYTLAFALLESLIATLPFIFVAIILPARFFKDRLVVLTAIIIIITSCWMMYANYHQINFAEWDWGQNLPILVLYLLSLALPIALVLNNKRFEEIVQAIVQRVAVLVYIYTALACLGILIILIRNL